MSNCACFSRCSISLALSAPLISFIACAMTFIDTYSIQAWFSGGFPYFFVKLSTKVFEAGTSSVWYQTVGHDLHTGNRTYDVNVWSQPENRDSLTDIQGLLIDTPSGGQVRLGDVADVSIVATPNAINREGLARRINVDAEVKGRDLGSVVADVELALTQIEFPQGYHPELIGEYSERQAASQRILIAGLVAMLVIFAILRVSVGSWRL